MLEHLGHENSYAKIKIKFTDTGSEVIVDLKNAIEGRVSDPALNNKKSKNFDKSRFDDYDKYINDRLFAAYYNMLDRCKNSTHKKICDRWLDINNFLSDVKLLPQFEKYYNNPNRYQLDKDYIPYQRKISQDIRIYSPEYCMWLYDIDNANLNIIEKFGDKLIFGIKSFYNNQLFQVKLKDNHLQDKIIGVFNDFVAAANAYNYWYLLYHNFELIPLLNNVPYMEPLEWLKHQVLECELLYELI